MYMDDKWIPVTGGMLESFLDRVGPIADKYSVFPESTSVGRRALPFYDSVELIRVKDPAWQPKNLFIYYLRDGDDLYWLNGTSPPLHEVNAKAPIKLTEENCIDYLEFFCFFVRGEDGPFLLAQTMSDTYVPRQVDDKTRIVLEGTLRPAELHGQDMDGKFLVDGTVYYSNAIFLADFKISPSGMIEMQDDEPIAADLPVKIDAPVS